VTADMEKAFNDILDIQGVREAVLISTQGETVFRAGRESGSGPAFPQSGLDVAGFAALTEADLFFEDFRVLPWQSARIKRHLKFPPVIEGR